MKSSWQKTLESLARPEISSALKGIRRGIEKESLRVKSDASLASTGHPTPLGSALTHTFITTDYAETLMEFITPADTDATKTIEALTHIHRHVYHHLGEELLWPASMPCTIETENDIKLADYGNSNVGKMKTIYRRGLKNRYGSMMQVIAGVHYNFSMPDNFWPVWQQLKGDQQPLQDFISASYLGLIRNFFRLSWLIPYLFGASPAVDSSFLKHSRSTLPLKTIGNTSHYLPNATSLRMSDLGYNSKEQDNLDISYNSLPEFISGLRQAVHQSNQVFEKIGVKLNGEYQQLNTNTLQQEAELYAPIRPKRTLKSGEKLSDALQTGGIEYVEVRSLDVNPYAVTGIDLEQIHFLDVFLTYCLLKDSPDISRQQQRTAKENQNKVTTCGRDTSLELLDDEKTRTLGEWADDIFSDLAEVARLLDTANHGEDFQDALDYQHQKVANPSLTPSARMLKDMEEQNLDVNELVLSIAKKHRQKLYETDYSPTLDCNFSIEAKTSLQKQKTLEEAETLRFDDFHRLTFGNLAPSPSPQCLGTRFQCSTLRKNCVVQPASCS